MIQIGSEASGELLTGRWYIPSAHFAQMVLVPLAHQHRQPLELVSVLSPSPKTSFLPSCKFKKQWTLLTLPEYSRSIFPYDALSHSGGLPCS